MSDLIDKLRTQKKQTVALFLGTSAIAGLILFFIFILPRSEPGSQVFLGLSVSRILIAAVFLCLLLVNIGAALAAIFDFGPRQQALQNKVTDLFKGHQTLVMVTFYTVFILTGAFLLLIIPPIIRPLSFLESVSARLSSFIGWIFLASMLLIVMLRAITAESLRDAQVIVIRQLDEALIIVGLFLVVFVLYAHFAALIGWINKTKYGFFDLLAGQFIKGKLYLDHPPYTHDLTFYNGKWYVPMPPLPAILMMPLAYLIGVENISTSYLSMVFSAINGVLLYLILKQFNRRKWADLSTAGIFILLVIFLFGTPHLWLGISGRGWYVSQILTALFLALSVYAALRSWSAWLVGTFIAIAMLARPNGLMSWPFAFAIAMQVLKENQGKVEWKQAIFWTAKTVPPIALAIAGLLTYNYLRFDNFLDFGYTTVNAGPDIVHNVQTWGTFSPHFILINLQVMLFKLPWIHPGGQWPIEPSTVGMSIFLTTPPLIYLFHRYPKQWWVIGAWVAVFFNVALLSLYHNTGSHQFGYRYILDFLVPLMLLLSVGLKRKIPWHFVLLVLASIAINMYGANWFMNG
jgi:hypothetical protein